MLDLRRQLETRVDQCGRQTALLDALGERLTWSQLYHRALDRARRLGDADLSKPIVYRAKNTAGDVITAIAVTLVGGIEAPLDDRLPETELQRRRDLLSQPPACGATGGVVLWTSGTTVHPAGVLQRHASWLGNAAAKLRAARTTADDVRLTVLPLSHAYGRTCDLGTWLIAGGVLAVGLGMRGVRKLAPVVRPTVMNVVPSMADALCRQPPAGLERLRMLGVGGAGLSVETFHAWRDRGVSVIQGYGLTETGPVIASATCKNAAVGLVGRLVDGWQHRIVAGELWVRGPHLMHGYWTPPRTSKLDRHGWFRTGDSVEFDPHTQQLRVLGRTDDVIVLPSAIKIHPGQVERQITQQPSVRHCFLCLRQQLELWVDGDPADQESISRCLSQHPWGRVARIRYFDRPLSIQAGELTAKLTLRRHVVRALIERHPD